MLPYLADRRRTIPLADPCLPRCSRRRTGFRTCPDGAARMKRFAPALAALVFSFAATARADLVPFNYQWVSGPTKVYADSSTTSYVEFIDGPVRHAGGDGNLVPANLKTVSPAPDA